MTFDIKDVENSIIARFEKCVAAYPDNIAVKDTRKSLKYSELNNIANHIAHIILQIKSEGPSAVVLLLEADIIMPAALLAVWKADCINVPINPKTPDDRIEKILLDSKADIVISSSDVISAVKLSNIDSVTLINIDELEISENLDNIEVISSQESLACILYTSGSTGVPKGVLHNHKSLLHYVYWYTKSLKLSEKDNLSLLFSYAFIPGFTGILRALLNGASLYLFNNNNNVVDLSKRLTQEKISILHTSPALFRQFKDSLEGNETFPFLRYIQLGGDAIFKSDAEFSQTEVFPNVTFSYGLGATETGPTRGMRISRKDKIPKTIASFPYVVENKEILIVNENGEPTAKNEIGLIAIKSEYLAVGYWRNKALTKKSFLATPDNKKSLFLTGDYGQLSSDGVLRFLGRKDNQLKIKGYRVEASEIECIIMDMPEVKQALVHTWDTNAGQKKLVGYIVLHTDKKLTTSAIYRFLIKKLPIYMIPSRFILLAEMPLQENGKISRQALPKPSMTRPNLHSLYETPRSYTEKKLTLILQKILEIEDIGIYDNFFELGGDSLAAVSLISEIEEQFNKVLPLAILFELGTIEQLAYEIEQEKNTPPWSPLVPIKTGGSNPPLFIVHPAGGNVLGFSEFISHMDAEQPVYGLQAFGVMKGQQAHSDIKTIAALYLQSIRTIQPKGPYYIAGSSFGGLVAFEMAKQLRACGDPIALLIIFDIWLLQQFKFNKNKLLFSRVITPFFSPPKILLSAIKNKLQNTNKRPPKIKKYKYSDEVHKFMSIAHRKAQSNYIPEKIDCNMVLIRTKDIGLKTFAIQHYFGDSTMGWKRLISGNIVVSHVSGTHHNFMHGNNALDFGRTIQQHCLKATTDLNMKNHK